MLVNCFHQHYVLLLFWKDPYLSRIDEVDTLVIDEADRMIEKGHFEELTQILNYINR